MWANAGRDGNARRLVFVAGDLLDQIDDAPAQLAVFDAHERLGQRQTVGSGEKVGDVSRRRRFAQAARLARQIGAPSKKNETGTWRMCEICWRRLAPMRLVPFSYFCTC